MASLSQLLALPGLGLELIQAGSGDPEITWVSNTELLALHDYLEGGEVIMTTGLSLGAEDARWLDFVAGLSRARVAAIGFGVGVNHDTVPAPLIQAASTYRVALFKIPLPVPFIAVSKAIAELLRLDELRSAHTALQAQRRILEGARGEQEPADVLASIAQATGRQLALISSELGGPETVGGTDPRRGTLLASTAGFAVDQAEFIPLDAENSLHLAIASGDPLTPEGSSVIAAGAMVLGLGLHSDHAASRLERERWELLTAQILDGSLPLEAVAILAPGTLTPRTVRAIAIQGAPEAVTAWRHEPKQGVDHLISASEELPGGLTRVWQLVDGDRPDAAVSRITQRGLDLVIGRAAPATAVALSVRSAQARLRGLPKAVTPYEKARPPKAIWADRDAPFLEAILSLASTTGTAGSGLAGARTQVGDSGSLSLAVLGSLSNSAALLREKDEADQDGRVREAAGGVSEVDRALLRATLHAVFAADGQRGPAASALGIHRNTLRDRVIRIERITGRSLSSAEDRAELWFALRSEELA